MRVHTSKSHAQNGSRMGARFVCGWILWMWDVRRFPPENWHAWNFHACVLCVRRQIWIIWCQQYFGGNFAYVLRVRKIWENYNFPASKGIAIFVHISIALPQLLIRNMEGQKTTHSIFIHCFATIRLLARWHCFRIQFLLLRRVSTLLKVIHFNPSSLHSAGPQRTHKIMLIFSFIAEVLVSVLFEIWNWQAHGRAKNSVLATLYAFLVSCRSTRTGNVLGAIFARINFAQNLQVTK